MRVYHQRRRVTRVIELGGKQKKGALLSRYLNGTGAVVARRQFRGAIDARWRNLVTGFRRGLPASAARLPRTADTRSAASTGGRFFAAATTAPAPRGLRCLSGGRANPTGSGTGAVARADLSSAGCLNRRIVIRAAARDETRRRTHCRYRPPCNYPLRSPSAIAQRALLGLLAGTVCTTLLDICAPSIVENSRRRSGSYFLNHDKTSITAEVDEFTYVYSVRTLELCISKNGEDWVKSSRNPVAQDRAIRP